MMRSVLATLLFSFCFSACSDDDNPSHSDHIHLDIPSAYEFDSRFDTGKSSVSYTGQVVRQLLINDLSIIIGGLAAEGASPISEADLLDLFDYSDSGLSTHTIPSSALEDKYSSIATEKNLKGKIDDDPVVGYNKTADQLMREWFSVIAANSQDSEKLGTKAVYTDANGVDLSQMTNKVLIGAVSYSQAMGYLGKVLDQDNTERKGGTSPYTVMEHVWDEAFGYFGAVRDYNNYNDDQLAGKTDEKGAFDANGDGRIDLTSEYSFGLSRNAAKRDRCSSCAVDFSAGIFNAFLKGRAIISSEKVEPAELIEQRTIIANGMEKVIAATVVHYINDTLSDMAALGTADENKANLNKHWAEMKGFTIGLQYNPDYGLISQGDLEQLHEIMGQAPAYDLPGSSAYNTTVEAYETAKSILQAAYGFSDTAMKDW